MKIKKIIIWAITYLVITTIGVVIYKKYFIKEERMPYRTENPNRRTIRRVIDTTGLMTITEKIKIGSLVSGIVKKLYADENEWVTKGKLLAEVDTGVDDANVKEAKGALLRAESDYIYYKRHLDRKKPLYASGQISKDEFDQAERNYLNSKGSYEIAKAQLYKADRYYKNTRITAPQDGIIIYRGVSEGERVTTDLDATILFAIAKDITKMEASLEIDESDIGQIADKQIVKFTVDPFPNRNFISRIKEISYSPKRKGGDLFYEAIIPIDNSEKIFRPGLSVDAKIFVAKVEDALAITSQAFMISSEVLKEIASDLGYSFNPIEEEELMQRRRGSPKETFQTVWVVGENGEPNSFIEKIVTTNLTDDIYYEITSGLTEEDDVVVELEESGYLEEIYKKAFGAKF